MPEECAAESDTRMPLPCQTANKKTLFVNLESSPVVVFLFCYDLAGVCVIVVRRINS